METDLWISIPFHYRAIVDDGNKYFNILCDDIMNMDVKYGKLSFQV